MAQTVKLDGVSVDAEDPCALWQALYNAKLKLLAGDWVEETEIQSPVTRRRIRVAVANIKAIDEELERLAAACQAKNGGGRRRYAARIRFT